MLWLLGFCLGVVGSSIMLIITNLSRTQHFATRKKRKEKHKSRRKKKTEKNKRRQNAGKGTKRMFRIRAPHEDDDDATR